MSRRERWAWILLLLFVAATRLVGLGDRAFSHDESLHGFYSHQLATRGLYQHDPMMHGPLQFHLNAALFALFGASDATARLTAAVAGIGAVLLLVAFRPLVGRRAALAAAALAALSPSLAFYSRYMRNEAYVAFACLLWTLGAFRYLETRRRRDLGWMVLGMGIAFAAKEVAFLFGLTAGLFLAGLAAWRARRGTERLTDGAAGELALLMAVLVAPFLGALLHLPFGWSTVAYDDPAAPGRALATCGVLALAALAAALVVLRGRGALGGARRAPAGLDARSLLTLALAFWGALAALFTTLGSNFPRGLVSGFVGSLGYWLSQHGVERGAQPVYYYVLLVVLYELLPLACALLAVGPAWRCLSRRGAAAVPAGELPAAATVSPRGFAARRALLAFLLWWSGASFVLYSLAGERMPWLTVHVVLPWLLLGGWGLARTAAALRRRSAWRRAMAVAALGLAAAATAGVGARLLYRDYDLATEMLVYAHGTPDLHRVVALLDALAAAKPPGERVVVAHDGATSWPLLWYLRDVEHRYLTKGPVAADLAGVDLLLLAPEASRRAWPLVARDFVEEPLLQLWWPVEAYRDPLRLATVDGWRAALGYLVTRRLPGVVVGPQWPLRQEMRLLRRRAGAARGSLPALAPTVLPLEIWRDPATDLPRKDGGLAPQSVAADAAGRLLVGERLGRELLRFDRAMRPLAADPAAGGIDATAIAPGDDGTVAVADAGAGWVRLFDATGRELARWGGVRGSAARRPTGIVRDGEGFVVADAAGPELCRLSPRLVPLGPCWRLDFTPEALAAGAGRLLLVDAVGRRLVAWRDGAVVSASPFPGWEAVPASGRPGLVELAGVLLATDPAGRRLLALDASGEPIASIEPRDRAGAPLWKRPEGLALDRVGGRLLLADRDAGRLYALPLPTLEAALASLAESSR